MAGITSGRITVRTVTAKEPQRVVVERITIPRTEKTGHRKGTARPGEGVLVGSSWVVFHCWTPGRLEYSVVAPLDVQVCHAMPVEIGER
jgi:hypothetical protein